MKTAQKRYIPALAEIDYLLARAGEFRLADVRRGAVDHTDHSALAENEHPVKRGRVGGAVIVLAHRPSLLGGASVFLHKRAFSRAWATLYYVDEIRAVKDLRVIVFKALCRI